MGGLFDGLKIKPENYRETISQFKELDLSLPIFKNDHTGTTNWDAISQSIEGCDKTALSYFKTLEDGSGAINNQSASVKGLSNYLEETGKSYDFAAVKATLLNTALNAGIMLAVSLFGRALAWGWDKFAHQVENANDAMRDAVSEYDSEQAKLEGINSELDAQAQRLDGLLAKDKLTYAEKGQLKELQDITRELQLQQDITERNAERASKEAADNAVKAYEKQYGNYDTSSESLDRILAAEQENHHFPVSAGANDITGNIASYITAAERFQQARADYENALKNGEDPSSFLEDSQWYYDMKKDTSEALEQNISDLQEKLSAMEDEYNRVSQKIQGDAEQLSTSEQEVFEAYGAIYDTIRLIYEHMAPDAWNEMEISNILHTEGIEKTKSELISMAEAAELTPEMIAGYQKLNEALQDSGLILRDDQTAAEAFCEQLNAMVQTVSEPEPAQTASPSQLLRQLDTRLRPALESLGSAYRDIFADGSFSPGAADLPMLDAIRSSIQELNSLEDVDIQIDMGSFDALASALTAADVTEDQARQAFNDFATSVFYASSATEGMADETKALVEQMLGSLGVANAAEAAEYALAEAKAQAVLASHDLSMAYTDMAMSSADAADAKREEFLAILAEGEAAGLTRQQIYRLTAAEIAFGQSGLSTEERIGQLKSLAAAYGDTASAALATAIANDLASGHTNADAALNSLMERINEGMGRVEIDFSGLEKSAARAGASAGRSYSDALRDELSSLNSVIRYIGTLIDGQVSRFQEQKEAAVDALEAEKEAAKEALEAEKEAVQEKIDAKQAEIDAIEDAAKARKDEMNLQKAQYDLGRMQNQKSILQYSADKGMHYAADTKGIREAEEAVTEAKENLLIAGIRKEISGLDDALEGLDKKIEESTQYYDSLIEQAEGYWDSLIQGLEDYKARWQELAGIEEQAKMEAALQGLGISTEDILNLSDSAFQAFQEQYLGILQKMYDGSDDILGILQRIGGVSAGSLRPLAGDLDSVADSIQRVSSSIGGSHPGGGAGHSPAAGSSPAASGHSPGQSGASPADASLTGSIVALGEAAGETLGRTGGDGVTGRFGELSDAVAGVEGHTAGIIEQMGALDGMTAECTITVHVETTGDIPGYAPAAGIGDAVSAIGSRAGSSTASAGKASPGNPAGKAPSSRTKVKGHADVTGEWGVRVPGRTLVGELGRELWVHAKDGSFETVGEGGAEFIRTEKGDLIFDHLLTEELLDRGRITGRAIPMSSTAHTRSPLPGDNAAPAGNITSSAAGITSSTADSLASTANAPAPTAAITSPAAGSTSSAADSLAPIADAPAPTADTLRPGTSPTPAEAPRVREDGAIITPEGTVLLPYDPDKDPTPFGDAFRKWNAAMAGMTAEEREAFLPDILLREQNHQMQENINRLTTISTQNIQPRINMGGNTFNITCPGVTSQAVMREVGIALDRKFSGLRNYTDQWIRRR